MVECTTSKYVYNRSGGVHVLPETLQVELVLIDPKVDCIVGHSLNMFHTLPRNSPHQIITGIMYW